MVILHYTFSTLQGNTKWEQVDKHINHDMLCARIAGAHK